ncbi:hypothetical protein EYC80_003112 [Monilinia laxa]|uniref:Zn(2)-C6 fungal-type domain-containing protein n=1 Tax=Monilinia laxa TaxID=61186 RepID=A0A5N6KCY1_MONLA|nr:hypothetical protein EYC80_003112 [Monilinia laxa]
MSGNLTKSVAKKEAPKRSRAFSTRAKTGCKTCKVRHVKCDEGRPGCRKCAATGRQCDGYTHYTPSPNPKPSVISSAIIPKSSSSIRYQSSPIIPEYLSPSLSFNGQEQHSFHFFHTQTAPQLGGAFGSKFWNHFVLQACHREPAVRHAAIALGSLHEMFELDDKFISKVKDDTEENSFALRQSANVALTACILFICFETLRGHRDSALAHIDGGVRILSELQLTGENITIPKKSIPEDHIPVSIFRTLFGRLDTQASILTSRARIIDGETELPSNSIPRKFSSLEEAREALESVWIPNSRNLLSCSMYNGVPLPLPANQETKIQLMARLDSWNRAFESYLCTINKKGFVGSPEPMSPIEKRAMNILHMQKSMTRILVTTSTEHPIAFSEQNGSLWDSFQLEFEAMVEWAAEIIHMPSDIRRESRNVSTFTLDNEILQPLFLVATRCRYRRIRNKAIILLKGSDRQEGLWNSLLIAKVAERIRDIEEAGLEDKIEIVPEQKRLRKIYMKFEFEGYCGRRAWLAFRCDGFPSAYESGEWIQLFEENTTFETFRAQIGCTDSSIQAHSIPEFGKISREPPFESELKISIKSEAP